MLDEELKEYKKKVEAAINRALTDSPEISAALQDIRDAGYDVFVMVEATVGFSRKDDPKGEPQRSRGVRLELTSHDEKFLRALRISPE
jgi:predicted ATPase